MAKNQEYPVIITITAIVKARGSRMAKLLVESLELATLRGMPQESWCSDVTVEGKIGGGEA